MSKRTQNADEKQLETDSRSEPADANLAIEDLPAEVRNLVELTNRSLEPMEPEAGIDRFLDRKSSEIRPRTVEEYRRKLTNFRQFCEMRGIDDLNDLDGRTVDEYRRWRRTESTDDGPLATKTMRDEMYLFRDFLEFLEHVEAVPGGLSEKLEVPSLEDGDGVRNIEIDPDRLESVLEHLATYEYASREHVVWVFHAHTGRRPGCLYALDLRDVHLDVDDPYVEFAHRPPETTLKNGTGGETQVALTDDIAAIFADYVEKNRIDVTTDVGREPFLTSRYGRLSKSAMRRYVYQWSRPCEIGAACPHGRDPASCKATASGDDASKCPSSRPPYALRHGYITQKRREGVPKTVLSDRCDVSEEIIEEHYDERDAEEKRELRQRVLDEIRQDVSGGGYL